MFGQLLIGFLGIVVVSYSLVAGLRRWAEKRQILDIPNERSSHQRPTPRGGGLAIVLITLLAWAVYGIAYGESVTWFWVWLGALLVASVGWLDDLYTLSNRLRFGVHFVSAAAAVAALGYRSVVELSPLPAVYLGWVGYVVALIWVVGLINAYNFMDGIDGMAGGYAVVAGLGWLYFSAQSDVSLAVLLGIVAAASSLGFLGHNWPPARIFMGDVASGFLGYLFAIMPLLFKERDSSVDGLLIGVLLLWPFLFDTIFTFLRRAKRRENVFAAHRSHLYQRLVITGLSHRFVTSLYIFLAGIGFLAALFYDKHWFGAILTIGIVLGCGLILLGFVMYQEQKVVVAS